MFIECESLHISPFVEPFDGGEGFVDLFVQAILRELACPLVSKTKWEIPITDSLLHEVHNQLRVVNQQQNCKDSGSLQLRIATDELDDIRATAP